MTRGSSASMRCGEVLAAGERVEHEDALRPALRHVGARGEDILDGRAGAIAGRRQDHRPRDEHRSALVGSPDGHERRLVVLPAEVDADVNALRAIGHDDGRIGARAPFLVADRGVLTVRPDATGEAAPLPRPHRRGTAPLELGEVHPRRRVGGQHESEVVGVGVGLERPFVKGERAGGDVTVRAVMANAGQRVRP